MLLCSRDHQCSIPIIRLEVLIQGCCEVRCLLHRSTVIQPIDDKVGFSIISMPIAFSLVEPVKFCRLDLEQDTQHLGTGRARLHDSPPSRAVSTGLGELKAVALQCSDPNRFSTRTPLAEPLPHHFRSVSEVVESH